MAAHRGIPSCAWSSTGTGQTRIRTRVQTRVELHVVRAVRRGPSEGRRVEGTEDAGVVTWPQQFLRPRLSQLHTTFRGLAGDHGVQRLEQRLRFPTEGLREISQGTDSCGWPRVVLGSVGACAAIPWPGGTAPTAGFRATGSAGGGREQEPAPGTVRSDTPTVSLTPSQAWHVVSLLPASRSPTFHPVSLGWTRSSPRLLPLLPAGWAPPLVLRLGVSAGSSSSARVCPSPPPTAPSE